MGYSTEQQKVKYKYMIAGVVTCFVMLICSAYDSPLFPLYNSSDSAIFMLIGKGITEGKLPYVDCVYCDPPYNSRNYCDLYHVLENVAQWKKPDVEGEARKMDRTGLKSRYCSRTAASAFERQRSLGDVGQNQRAHIAQPVPILPLPIFHLGLERKPKQLQRTRRVYRPQRAHDRLAVRKARGCL